MLPVSVSQPPPPALAPNCAQAGVLGALPGFMGALQASEAIQRLIGLDTGLSGHMLTADLRRLDIRRFALSKNPDCPSCVHGTPMVVTDDTCEPQWRVRPDTFSGWNLVDVRSPAEHATHNLGGVNTPIERLADSLATRLDDVPVLLYCQSGARSDRAVAHLRAQGHRAVFSLAGGITGWSARAPEGE